MKSIAGLVIAATAAVVALACPGTGGAARHVHGSRSTKSSTHQKLCASPMTEDIIACGVEDQRVAERRMDDYLQKVRSRIMPEHRESLDDSQRKWAAYRDSYCSFIGLGTEGGTVQPYIIAECKGWMAEERAKDLKEQVKCKDGDLSCAY